MCTCVCMHIRALVYVSMYDLTCVSVCIYVCKYIKTSGNKDIKIKRYKNRRKNVIRYYIFLKHDRKMYVKKYWSKSFICKRIYTTLVLMWICACIFSKHTYKYKQIYTDIHTYMHSYLYYISTYVYMFMCIYTYNVYMYIYIICIFVYMYICAYICIYVSMNLCVYMYICV